MGLLDRVVSEEIFPGLPDEKGGSPFNEKMGLLEGAPLFLRWIIDSWGTPNAALLAYDSSSETFLPMETSGLDVTTRRRLILEKNTISEWTRGRHFAHIREKSLYAPYFSSRESGLSGSLILLPCRKDEVVFALVAVLLDEEDKRTVREDLLTVLEDETVMEKLYKSLFPAETKESDEIICLDREELKKRILTDGEECILLRVPLASLLELVKTSDPLKDEHDSQRELLALFASFFNERVSLFLDDRENLFILQPGELFPGLNLMRNQLILGLRHLLGENVTEEKVNLDLLEKPSDRKALDNYLAD